MVSIASSVVDEISTISVKDGKMKPNNDTKLRRRHSVDFLLEHKEIEFEMLDELERPVYWYTQEEYDYIRSINSTIVRMKKYGSFEESEDHTFRGLEHKLKEGFTIRRENKFNALNAVLEEQDRQYSRGQNKPEIIAEAYKMVSARAKDHAVVNGIKDFESSFGFEESRAAMFHSGGSVKVSADDDDDDVDDNTVLSDIGLPEGVVKVKKKKGAKALFKKFRRRSSV
jgi:hypothetical protein